MTLVPRDRGDPEVAVVMVTHGAWSLTEQALAELAANTDHEYELIVVDNRSEDESRARMAELRDAQLILNEENRGFGPATNQGAALARAPHLVLLNSDAFVHAGWLQPLLDGLVDESVGAAVPRFLNPDGSLQDAGPLLARDGTVHVYGDGDDPERPCYRFRRFVDYGSAACMLIRRRLFEELGGFDDAYAPAYYEDADLGRRLADRELKVLYEPRSTVTHVRYGSGARGRAMQLSDRNRRLFADRWGAQLAPRPWTFADAPEQAVIMARDAAASPRFLIISPPALREAGSLAEILIGGWPSARVTWALRVEPMATWSPDPWLRLGVEVLDAGDPSWLARRLFLYDLVVVGGELEPRLAEALQSSQPQAPRVALDDFGDGGDLVTTVLAAAGIAPASIDRR